MTYLYRIVTDEAARQFVADGWELRSRTVRVSSVPVWCVVRRPADVIVNAQEAS